MDHRIRVGSDDDPRLGLAEPQAERVAGKRSPGMKVNREPLAGVEHFHQQGGVCSPPLDVLGPEELRRTRLQRVA